jgi:competence protein ComFC
MIRFIFIKHKQFLILFFMLSLLIKILLCCYLNVKIRSVYLNYRMIKSIMLNNILRLIYPSLCQSCALIIDQGQTFCFSCQSKIKPVVPVFLALTKKYTLTIHAACAYEDPVKPLLFKKFSHDTLACKQLANLMVELVPFDTIKADFLIPVPLHWSRFAWRGYNQADLIAKQLSRRLNIPTLNMVKRKHRTIFQSKLSQSQRQKNVENVFSIKSNFSLNNPIKDKNIVIIDDLFTTGATVKNVAQTLSYLQPASICIAVACRTI